ncbi:conserved hypothetical protein [Candidatus Nitrospira nitrificans]|uniref:Uncharacterized protein n=1 Tax=Candidatus Nitrospira nitrificans TaxID=1742973 RepID=A0A0S4LQ82_9BACT|nr:conserved hypothetical protein [Candidatus Nitrospira nitrificans]
MKRLGLDEDFESTVGHTFIIKGHILWIAHLMDTRVFHHFGVDAVAVGTRREQDVREDHCLAGFGLGVFCKRYAHLRCEIVADALFVVEGAVLAPDLRRLLRETSIRFQVFPWNGQDVSIDISHEHRPFFLSHHEFDCTAGSCGLGL